MSTLLTPSVILCSTPRLARSLRLAQQKQHVQDGATQWQPTSIFTLSEWLSLTVESAILMGEIALDQAPSAPLTNTQEGLLWEQAIQQSLKSNVAASLFDTSGLASAAMEANRLIIEWNISINMEHATEETQQLMQWRQRFQTLCKQAGMLETVRYQAWQIECIEQGTGQLPTHLALAGFDNLHPHVKRLMRALTQRGTEVSAYDLTLKTPQKCTQVLLTDQDAECRAAVAWAHSQLVENPHAQLAIVVPDLDKLRAKLANLLDDTFHPEAAAPANAEMLRCYDFSLGVALNTVPMIATALALIRLAWQRQPFSQPDIARLLHSPYWSSHLAESHARAQLDARMRRQLPLNFHAKRLLSFMQHAQQGEQALAIDDLTANYAQLLQLAEQQPRQQTASAWANVFKQALAVTRWQGDRALSSHEYQAAQSFERVLQQLASLDPLLSKVSANEALKRLTQLCQAQIFQPENKVRANILVMGLMEASAEPLDALWVMGMNDHVWPPVARPNALIPAELQRKANTPNASSEVQTAFALAVHQRLMHSAHQVIFSSAEKDGDRPLRVSPMLQGIPLDSTSMPCVATLAEQLASVNHADWQWLDDYTAPPVLEQDHVSGGTALLKAQAICPAWAFYQYRLGARKLNEPVNGLDVMERGNLVHAVLAALWKDQYSEVLLNQPIDTLSARIGNIAQEVLNAFNAQKEGAFPAVFLQLEQERLTKLVLAWLTNVEMQRPQAFQVTACEEMHTIAIEGIRIKLVIDRVDTLENGRLLVMDYKTGRQMDYKNWAQATITEPQLPIYAAFVLEAADVAAVCFAKLRAADVGVMGVAAEADLIQGAVVFDEKRGRAMFDEATFPHWQNVIQHWKTSITNTALALKAGDAAVRIADEKLLAFCEVLPLLRLPERQLQFEHGLQFEQTSPSEQVNHIGGHA